MEDIEGRGGGYRDGREGVGYRYEEEMNNDNMKTDTS